MDQRDSTPEHPSARCQACGSALPPGVDRLCPGCLLRVGLANGADDKTIGTGWPADDATGEAPGTVIGHYKLVEQIGEGGFGVVWMAEQLEPVRRRVALKIIKLGMDTREVVARFAAERQALAMMEHPNIAGVYDGGTTASGRPYFVMELVKGVPVTTYCDAKRLTTRERLELFMDICHAVQHAHQKGVIHRDLKPSNILITERDDRPVPKVIDFGIAKATLATLAGKTLFTRLNQWVGTPAYMSPEQAGQGSLDIDTRSDIYTLGVLLYELLTGRPPFDPEKLLATGYDTIMKVIREEDPPKPSTRLSTLGKDEINAVTAAHGAEPARLDRLVRGDLDRIVMKALEKDRRRRYDSANALADDLRRHLDHEPVSAAAPTLGYMLGKFARRHRLAAAWTVSFVLLLLLATIVSSILAWNVHHQKERAEKAEGIALDNLYAADIGIAQRALEAHQVARARELLRAYIPRAGGVDRRGIEWRKLWGEARGSQIATIPNPIRGEIDGIAFTPDDEYIVAAGAGGVLCVIHAEDFTTVSSTVAGGGTCRSVAVSADGTRVATCSDGPDGATSVWKMAPDGKLEPVWQSAFKDCWSVAISSDARTLAVGMDVGFWPTRERSGITRIFEMETGREIAALPESGGRAVAYSGDGRWLATGPDGNEMLHLWDARSLALVKNTPLLATFSLNFSPDSQLLLAGSGSGKVSLYQLPGLETAAESWSQHQGPNSMSFAGPRRIFARCDGPVVGLQDYSAQHLNELAGHGSHPRSVSFNHRGDWLVSGSLDGEMLLWRTPGSGAMGPVAKISTMNSYFDALPLAPSSPGGTKVAVLAVDGVHVLDAGTGRTISPLCPPAFPIAFAGEDSLLVIRGLPSLESDRIAPRPEKLPRPLLDWWDLRTHTRVEAEIRGLDGKEITSVAVSPDHSVLALAWLVEGASAGFAFVDAHSGTLRRNIEIPPCRITTLEFAPDGQSVALTTSDGRLELIAYPSAEIVKTLTTGNGTEKRRPVFSPDGKLLAVGDGYGIRLWRLADGRDLGYFGGYNLWVDDIQFSADGKTLSGGNRVDTKFWHLPTRREMLQLPHWDKNAVLWLPMAGEKFVIFRNRASYWEVAPLPPLDRAEEWLHAQPASLSEARRMLMAIPARDPNTPAGLLDLERHYSGGLAQPWQGLVGNNLGTLPHGVQRMKSGVFDIRGVVLPDGVGRPSTIQVGRTCERLRFLHNATHRSMEPKPGMTIGRYVIHYADSQTAEVPLVIGRTIQHWWSDPATLESSGEAEVAWIGTNDLSRQSDRTIHLLGLIWTNPRPEVPVTSFDFEQAGADFRPFLVAVTAE